MLTLFYGFNSATAPVFNSAQDLTIDGTLGLNGASFTAANITVNDLIIGSGFLTAGSGGAPGTIEEQR